MPATEASAGGQRHSVIDTGTVTLPKGATALTIQVIDLRFVISFVQDASNPATRVDASIVGKSLALTYANWNNALPTSWEAEVGTINGLPLVIVTTVVAVGDTALATRTIHYTFYTRG